MSEQDARIAELADEYTRLSYGAFIDESNRIEGIDRAPKGVEIDEMVRFMALPAVTLADMGRFVSVYQPGARLRDQYGLDVRVGSHVPPKGSPEIRERLEKLLRKARRVPGPKERDKAAYAIHCQYETLHPFMDGNGRSGRMLWAWQMQRFPLGFLHHWYYQSLAGSRFAPPERMEEG